MIVSTKSEYFLRALIYLARNSDREAVPAREIAGKWNLSYNYKPCEFESGRGLKAFWARARSALIGVLDQTILADLCTRADRPCVVSLKSSSGRS